MTVIGIKNITKKDLPLYYRRVFSGTAVFKIQDQQYERGIEFIIEMLPTGAKQITVNFLERLDSSLNSILSDLRDQVATLEKSGSLP